MLTAEGCANRRKRLWEAVPETVDAMLLADPASLIYFANYAPSPFVFRSCDASAVLILERDRATLVADKMVHVFLDQAYVDEVVAPVWYDGKHAAPHRKALLVKTAVNLLVTIPGSGLAVETASLPAGIIMGMESARGPIAVHALEDIVRGLRRRKDPDEIALIRASILAGEAGHAAALAQARPGMTEMDVYALVQHAATEAAGQPVIVYGDFVSGPRVELEHGGSPGPRVIEKGDLFLLDYSVIVHGYRGDFTNTFAVGGPPTQAQRDLFKACLECMDAAEAVLKPGVAAQDVDHAARGHAESLGLGHAYISHTGHGLGLSHPEPPYFVPESDEVVMEGEVVAIEPGLFVPGSGGMRFERNYLLTKDGFENLTHHRLTLEP